MSLYSQQALSYQRYYHDQQYLCSPFSPIDNTNDDQFHTHLIHKNQEIFQQLLKEDKNIFIRSSCLHQIPSTLTLSSSSVIGSSINLFKDLSYLISHIGIVLLTLQSLLIHQLPLISSNMIDWCGCLPSFMFPLIYFVGLSMFRSCDWVLFQFDARSLWFDNSLPPAISHLTGLDHGYQPLRTDHLHPRLGDSNLANFRQIFIKIHSRRPAMAQEFQSTISETEKVPSSSWIPLLLFHDRHLSSSIDLLMPPSRLCKILRNLNIYWVQLRSAINRLRLVVEFVQSIWNLKKQLRNRLLRRNQRII